MAKGRRNTGGKISFDCVQFLNLIGHKAWHVNNTPVKSVYITRGVPDVECCLRGGQYLGVEIKTTDKQRPEQAEFQRRIEAKGGRYVIVHSKQELINYLERENLL